MARIIDPEGMTARIVHELIDFRGKDVLEVGCGDGRITWSLGEQARSVVALDIDETDIGNALRNTPEALKSKVTFRLADVVTCDLPENAFDVAVFSGSL